MSDYFIRGTCLTDYEPRYFSYGTAAALNYSGPIVRRKTFIEASKVATQADVRRIVREELERARFKP